KDVPVMDRRVGEPKNWTVSSNSTQDEVCVCHLRAHRLLICPPYLLPHLTGLGAQGVLLAQLSYTDSTSRCIMFFNTEFERTNSSNSQAALIHRTPSPATALQEQIAPVPARMAPILPAYTHILTHLGTLFALHISAASFWKMLEDFDDLEEQRRVRAALGDL
ncbi:hypothetical protein V8D89_015987, partial [Ganoderma adspersum]